jgi:hypothetical protein
VRHEFPDDKIISQHKNACEFIFSLLLLNINNKQVQFLKLKTIFRK